MADFERIVSSPTAAFDLGEKTCNAGSTRPSPERSEGRSEKSWAQRRELCRSRYCVTVGADAVTQ